MRHYFSLIRFSHTVFALPFALLAALMAWRQRAIETGDAGLERLAFHIGDYQITIPALPLAIRWQELAGILLCMVFARSAAMAFNRLADRQLDAANPRTAGRHLPSGVLSVRQVALFAAGSAIAFVASTLLFLPNRLPLYFSAPVLAFLCGYSYAKRFTALAHVWLGAALATSPVAAWISIRGDAVVADPADLTPAFVLAGAVLTWVAGFDVIYACQDAEHDQAAGLHSIPARLGVSRALRLAAALHIATIGFLAWLPAVYAGFDWIFGGGVALAAGLLVYEHSLVRPGELERVNLAFFNVNAVISLGLLAVGLVDLLIA